MKQITPGVDLEIFTPDSTIKRENIFLSIGRIQEQKGKLKQSSFWIISEKLKIIFSVILLEDQVVNLVVNI